MTIRMKLGLLVSALVAATVALGGVIQYATERRARLAEAESALMTSAQALAVLADQALPSGDLPRLSTAAQAAFMSDHLLFGSLVRSDGRSLWREARPGYSEPLNEEGLRGALATGRAWRSDDVVDGRPAIEWVLPIKARSDAATGATGTRPLPVVLRAGFDAGEVRAAAAAAAAPVLKRLLLAGCAGLLLGLVGATWLSANFTRTIRKLMMGAQEMGAGHFSVRVMTRRGDELGELSEEFNVMGHRLEELERLKDSFLAKITHDLRSPLSAIVCYADVMQMGTQGPLTERQQQSLKLISESGNDLAQLINNILDMTKLEAGKMSLAPAEVDLRPVAQSVTDLLQVKASEFGVQLDASGVPEGTMVYADEQALNRILSNLVSNSLKFTPKGGRVTVSWQRDDAGDDVLVVKDTGIGIPKDKIPTLFQKFSQVDETMHKVRFARGTGLGLAICREIAEAHGGRAWVDSEYQRGSTFYVSLPKKPADIPAQPAAGRAA